MVGKTVLLITLKVNIESTWRLAQCSKQLTTQSVKWCYQRPSLDRWARASSIHLPSEQFTSQLWTWCYTPMYLVFHMPFSHTLSHCISECILCFKFNYSPAYQNPLPRCRIRNIRI